MNDTTLITPVELKALCEMLEQEALDDLVHDEKAAEAAGINNDGKEAQVVYLLSNGWTSAEIQKRAGKTDMRDIRETFVRRLSEATDAGIKMHGRYTFDDRGPREVMEIDDFVEELKKMDPKEAGTLLEAVASKGYPYLQSCTAIVYDLDTQDDNWWEVFIAAVPSVSY